MKVSLKFVPYFFIILGSMPKKKKSSTGSNLIREWIEDLIVSWYFGIDLVVVRLFICVTV